MLGLAHILEMRSLRGHIDIFHGEALLRDAFIDFISDIRTQLYLRTVRGRHRGLLFLGLLILLLVLHPLQNKYPLVVAACIPIILQRVKHEKKNK